MSDFAGAREAISYSCETWGGAAQRLVPATYAASPAWSRLINEVDSDFFRGLGVDEELLPERPRAWAGAPVSLVAALDALLSDTEHKPSMSIPSLDDDDPWTFAYDGICGTLPEGPSPLIVERSNLREGITYSEVLDIDRPRIEGGVADLWSRVADRSVASPTAMTLAGLKVESAPQRRYAPAPILPHDVAPGMRFGSAVIVVYTPGSLEDLCLLWALRAAWGWPYSMPLAVPGSIDVAVAVRAFERLGAAAGSPAWRGGRNRALVSGSITQSELDAIADELGVEWTASSIDDVLAVAPRPRRTSIEVATFEDGRAPVFAWGARDLADLGEHHPHRYLDTITRFRPLSMKLPPAKSLTGDLMMNGTWRGGAFEVAGNDVDRLHSMLWPVGWTVLEAVARDRGVEVRRSRAGRAAEALVQRIGSLDEVSLLSDAEVLRVLYRLGERSGITFFRRKTNEMLADLRSIDSVADRVAALESHLDSVSASVEDASPHTITASSLSPLGTREDVRAWLEWAEQSGVLLRGAEVHCPRCGHKQWITLAQLAPPFPCGGCSDVITKPYREDNLSFRYRASEALLRTLEHDSLGHLLTLAWMAELFHRGFDKPESLYGGYPGVDILDASGEVIGEVDVLLLFSDGSIAVGEYKRSGAGLNEAEVGKLEVVADALGAAWTFVATHDSAAHCPDLWKQSQQVLPERPRFALTGEHLYSHAIWAMGSNPFEWPDSDSFEPRERGGVVAAAKWLADRRTPDSSLHQHWRYLDSRSSE